MDYSAPNPAGLTPWRTLVAHKQKKREAGPLAKSPGPTNADADWGGVPMATIAEGDLCARNGTAASR